MFRSSLLILSSILSLFFWCGAYAQDESTTVVERHVVVTPAPKSASCTTIAAHWEGNTWVDTQTACKYENRTEGAAWVQDYWACTAVTATGDCTSWQFMPGHWVQSLP